MNSQTAIASRPSARRMWFALIPLMGFAAWSLMEISGANHAISRTADAAAPPASVVVNGTVNSNLDLTPCATPHNFTISLGGYSNSGSCATDFGANNDATTYLTVRDTTSADNFFIGTGTIADQAAGACAALATVDEGGIKISANPDATINTATWGAACSPATAAGTNDDYSDVPNAATIACASSAMNTTNTCTFTFGVFETGSDLAAGTYTGTAEFGVSAT